MSAQLATIYTLDTSHTPNRRGETMGFARTPNDVIRDPSLSIQAKAIYTLLSSYVGNGDDCWPSLRRLAHEMGASMDSVRRWIRELQKRGLVTIEERSGDSSLYRLHTPGTYTTPSTHATPPLAQMQGDPLHPCHPKKNNEEEQEKEQTFSSPPASPKRVSKPKIDPMAETIYAAYPRKVGKEKALKAITTAIASGRDPTDLLEAVQAYAAYWASRLKHEPDERQYIPHPATWFNQGRYDDDRSEWQYRPPSTQSAQPYEPPTPVRRIV